MDERSFVTKSNFLLPNYCCILSLMITTNAFFLPRTIPFKVLKVNKESKHWESIFWSESLNIKKARSDFDATIHDLLLNDIKDQNQVNRTAKGMKDTLANISYISFKIDYYYNLEKLYNGIELDNREGEKDNMDSFYFLLSESNPTPRTAITRIKGIGDHITQGVYNSLMVNEFLIH